MRGAGQVVFVLPLLNPFLFITMLSCPRYAQASLFRNYLKLSMPEFPYNLPPVTREDIGFSKMHSVIQEVAWMSGHKVLLLPLRPSCPLLAILLDVLVGYCSPLADCDFNLKRAKRPL